MSKPLTAAEIVAALRYWLVPTRYVSGWQGRSNGGTWGDVTGCMFHHTGDDAPDETTLRLLVGGRSDLRGPLCNFGSGDDGILDVISAGPANHAGGGDPRVLAAVQRESYTDYPPATHQHQNSAGSVGGNSRFYGWEVYYAGPKDPTINDLQYRVTVLSQAAITWALAKKSGDRWTARSTIGHKEWSDWKPDPKGVDMKQARADIQWCLDNGPVAARRWYDTGTKTAAAEEGEDFMGLSIKDLEDAIDRRLQDEQNIRILWTGRRIMADPFADDPGKAPRVAPSTVIEAAAGITRGRPWPAASSAPVDIDYDLLAEKVAEKLRAER